MALTLVMAVGYGITSPCYATVTINQVDLPTYWVNSVNTFDITGADMVGMAVTFYWTDGVNDFSQTTDWVMGPGAHAGHAQIDFGGNNYFSLQQNNDTFANPWDVDSKASGLTLMKIVIDGFPGSTGFDRSFGDTDPGRGQEDDPGESAHFGTPGSYRGLDFDKTGGKDTDVIVTYSSAVYVGANAPEYDIFRYLTVEFLSGLEENEHYSWKSDTDKFDPVPLPSSVILLGSGLLRLLSLGQRKARP